MFVLAHVLLSSPLALMRVGGSHPNIISSKNCSLDVASWNSQSRLAQTSTEYDDSPPNQNQVPD